MRVRSAMPAHFDGELGPIARLVAVAPRGPLVLLELAAQPKGAHHERPRDAPPLLGEDRVERVEHERVPAPRPKLVTAWLRLAVRHDSEPAAVRDGAVRVHAHFAQLADRDAAVRAWRDVPDDRLGGRDERLPHDEALLPLHRVPLVIREHLVDLGFAAGDGDEPSINLERTG